VTLILGKSTNFEVQTVVCAVGKCCIVVVCNRYGKGKSRIVPVDPMKRVGSAVGWRYKSPHL
jgi:hypothetical protein